MFTELENIYNKLLRLVFRQSSLEKATSAANRLKKDWIENKENHLENGLVDIDAATKLKQMSSQNQKGNSKASVSSLRSMPYSRSMKDHPYNSALSRMHNL